MKIALHISACFVFFLLPAFGQEAVNLLSNNPGFEDQPKFMLEHGVSNELPGWLIDNTAYNVHSVGKEDEPPDGNFVYVLNMGGSLETAPDSRATITAGQAYALTFFSKKIRIHHPDVRLGLQFSLVFYDAEGKKISAEKGEESQKGAITDWEKMQVQATSPVNAVQAGVRVVVPRGIHPKADVMDFKLDNFAIAPASATPIATPVK